MSESTSSKVLRIFSALAMCVVALAFGAIDLMFIEMVYKDPFGKNIILALMIFSVFTAVPSYIAWKFFQGSTSSNGRTMLPSSFFIGLGAFFILVSIICGITSHRQSLPLLTTTLPISILFILIGVRLRRGKASTSNDKMLKDL